MSTSEPNYSYPQQNYPGGGYQPVQEHPQGTLILVLGILGFFTGITGIVAWVLGSKALKEIRASGVSYSNEQSVVIGRILGIITTILTIISVLIVIAWIIFFVVVVAASGDMPR